jgi:Zn-dependent protease/CBS domain-containing protein
VPSAQCNEGRIVPPARQRHARGVAQQLRGSIKLFSILGIPVEINGTWLIAVAIITWSLATAAYPSFFSLWSTSQYWIAGIITTLLLFTSVLAHELGHSIVAMSQGLKVRAITLLLFGGVSQIQGEASRPRNEFFIAFAGPMVSLAIGIALIAWWFIYHPAYEHQTTPLHGIIFFTGWMNILVAAFNLLPGYPMDGGRVLRSAVWGFTGDTRRASRVAYMVGRVVFYLMIGWGVWRILNGDVMGGIWVVMIGWFLMTSAKNEARGEAAKREADSAGAPDHLGFNVGLATTALPPMVEADTSVSQLLAQGMPAEPTSSIPIASKGELIGFIVRQDIDDVPREQRSDTTVDQLMSGNSLRVISMHDTVRDALKMMDTHRVHQLVVMDDDFMIGVVTPQDIVAALLQIRSTDDIPGFTDGGTSV